MPKQLNEQQKRLAVLVAGMHRSGTSAVTRVLNLLGCALPKTLLPDGPGNELGHWESRPILNLNNEILASGGSFWDDWEAFNPSWFDSFLKNDFLERAGNVLKAEFGDSRMFILKDPRNCRLLKFWIEAVEAFEALPLVVIPIRNPFDVAASLEKRDGIDRSIVHLLWLRHVLAAEADSRSVARAFIRYDDLVCRWRSLPDRLAHKLGISWPRRSTVADIEIEQFLSPAHRHHAEPDAAVFSKIGVSDWLRSSFEILERWTRDDFEEADLARLDAIREAFDRAAPAFGRPILIGRQAVARNGALETELDIARARYSDLNDMLAARDSELAESKVRLSELGASLAARDSELAESKVRLSELGASLAAQDSELAESKVRLTEIEAALAARNSELAETKVRLSELGASLAAQDSELAGSKVRLTEIEAALAARDSELAESELRLKIANGAREGEIERQRRESKSQNAQIEVLQTTVLALRASTSWRVTRPLRAVGFALKQAQYGVVGYPLMLAFRALRTFSRAPLRDWLATRAIANTDLFDRNWYLNKYPDVAAVGIDPVRHYVAFGAREGRDPSARFSTRCYLAANPDVAASGINALAHYVRFGYQEERQLFPIALPTRTQKSLARPAPELFVPRVLIIAEAAVISDKSSMPQCKKYRVTQKAELFESIGVDCTVISWQEIEKARNALQSHSVAIFYRVPGYPEVLDLIADAKRLNVPTIWEVDDLIFDEVAYRANRNIDLLEPQLRHSVLAGVPFFLEALKACDYAIASTRTLADEMQRAGPKCAFVIPNALDAQTLTLAKVIRERTRFKYSSERVQIIYGSGSKAHDADFSVAAMGLASALKENPGATALIVGDVTLPPELEAHKDQIARKPFTDYDTYLGLLGDADIAIAPLEPSLFNAAKSNIKYLEAAILAIPCICSPLPEFASIIEQGFNGFLAQNETEWRETLNILIRDPELRIGVGNAALRSIAQRYSLDTIAYEAAAPLIEQLGKPDQKRLRVLIANIFFSPQSFGGATIVAEQLAIRLAARDDTEVAIFASWGEVNAAPYALNRYEAKGLTCFGVKLPHPERRELDYENPAVGDVFFQVLKAFRPHVVHLHSIQGLSASIAECCRKMEIPYIVTLHDAWWLCERQFMVRSDGRYCFQEEINLDICAQCVPDYNFAAVRQRRLRTVLNDADLILTPSAFHRALYLSNGIAPNKVNVNRNGVRFPRAPLEVRKTNARLRFGFVGGVGPIKGLDLIIAAFKELPYSNYDLILVDNTLNLGFGSLGACNIEVPGKVVKVPAYTQDTMDDFFSNIDVLLFPSQWKESFGLTVREALVRNVWVIVTDSGGASEDVISGVNGTIIPMGFDHGPLREAVAALLAEPNKLDGYSNPYRGGIASFDQQAEELHSFIISVATKTPIMPIRAPER